MVKFPRNPFGFEKNNRYLRIGIVCTHGSCGYVLPVLISILMIPEIFSHRSIRHYLSKPIPEEVLQRVLEAGIRASNTGNMQLYSLIVTTSPEIRAELAPCHFNQPMVTQAPALITFCADIHRFSQWCRQRQAEPQYDNFLWFVNGVIDTILASQNIVLAAEHEGLGICYLGTTPYNAQEIAKILQLPQGVIPVTTISLGYPDPEKMPSLTDRLPLEGVVHRERYHDYTPEQIDQIWAEREASEETAELLAANELPNLARIFTERRYTGKDNLFMSRKYFEMLKQQGFFNQ